MASAVALASNKKTMSFTPVPNSIVQRKCACGTGTSSTGTCEQCSKKKGMLQRKASFQQEPPSVPPNVHDVLQSPGQPLDLATRSFFEPRFGYDFSRVRVHTDKKAEDSAKDVNSQAYTVGQHIVFGADRFAPQTKIGKILLSHELTHTVQQRTAPVTQLKISPPNTLLEIQADQVANRMMVGQDPLSTNFPMSSIKIQRKVENANSEFINCDVSTIGTTIFDISESGENLFLFDSETKLLPDYEVALRNRVANISSDTLLEIHGFGSDKELRDFSCSRAYVVKQVLEAEGVNSSQIQSLVAHQASPGDLESHRSVVLKFVGTGVVEKTFEEKREPTILEKQNQKPVTSSSQGARKQIGLKGAKKPDFLQLGWTDVNQLGIVYKPEGANYYEFPESRRSPSIRLPQNTKPFILKQNPKVNWYAVSTADGTGGSFGYINRDFLAKDLPDPDSDIYKIKSGDNPLRIAAKHYSGKGFDVWAKDKRYVVNALVWVNAHAKHNFKGETGLTKPYLNAPWWEAESKEGPYIWLPGAEFLNAIYEKVAEHGGGTGSVTGDLWRGVKKVYEYVAYGAAFVGGLFHGFLKSIYDAIAGLVETIFDVLKSIFTGNVINDAKELWEAVSKITWKGITDALGDWALEWDKKLSSANPWTAGHAHGYLTGYIMGEAAQLLISAGTLAAAKAAIWGTRLGKAIKATRAYQNMVKGLEAAGKAGSKTHKLIKETSEVIRQTKPFKYLGVAKEWAKNAFNLSKEFLEQLSLPEINRLRQLSDSAITRIKRFPAHVKKKLFGCASPCEVDLEAIKRKLASLTDEEIEKFLSQLDPKKHSKVEPQKQGKRKVKYIPLPLENVLQIAMSRLKKQGVKGLPPQEYGTKLAAAVEEVVVELSGQPTKGWVVAVEKPFRTFAKISRENAILTVEQYMKKYGMTDQFPKLSEKFLRTKIEDLKPDVYVRAPDGQSLVWDVTSQPEARHIAKTMFYTEVLAREMGGLHKIGESYWKKFYDWNWVKEPEMLEKIKKAELSGETIPVK